MVEFDLSWGCFADMSWFGTGHRLPFHPPKKNMDDLFGKAFRFFSVFFGWNTKISYKGMFFSVLVLSLIYKFWNPLPPHPKKGTWQKMVAPITDFVQRAEMPK